MPYLTYAEYKDFGFSEIDETEFNRLIKKAGDAVDGISRFFYQFNDIEDDVEFRRTQFKKAVAAQVEYFHDIGATSSHEINNPLSVQIGRTQVSTGANNQKKLNSIISDDSVRYLRGTGLLYRGLGVMS